MLLKQPGDTEAKLLQASLRFLVNEMRKTNFVFPHTIDYFRLQLSRSGFYTENSKRDHINTAQQDITELYLFLSERLGVPQLALSQHILHGGKELSSDHTVVAERILQIAIQNKEVSTLKSNSWPKFPALKPSSKVKVNDSKRPLFLDQLIVEHFNGNIVSGIKRMDTLNRSYTTDGFSTFSILPFFNVSGDKVMRQAPTSDPTILPICLKRYTCELGSPVRVNQEVVVPIELSINEIIDTTLPQLSPNIDYKLVLKAAICHKGSQLNQGHYISYTKWGTDNWLKFDDMSTPTVTVFSSLQDILNGVLPDINRNAYLLFYELVQSPADPSLDKTDFTVAQRLQQAQGKRRRSDSCNIQ
jgi:hypothetical protein